ncbi:MAG TPA: PKD domain-containing protein [Terriglobales bacterium]|nr:PKD domain-containing protein [Terriglobales bacterium]
MTRFAKLFAITFVLVLACGVFLRGSLPQVSTGAFQSGAEMAEARTGGAAVTLDDGRLLVFGGTTASGGATNAVQVFDPASNSWSDLGVVMLDARSGHSATALADGRILLAGGENSSGPLSSLELYDPASNSFASAGTLSAARKSHGAARLPDGRVLIIGGSDGSNALASSEIYDPESGSVSAGPSMSAPRSGASVTALLDGKVLIAGGNNGEADLASTEIYNPADGSFSAGANLSVPRSGHTAILLPSNNSVLIAGGSSAGSDLSSAELYVPWTASVSATGAMSAARSGAAGSGLKQDGIALVAGGSGSQSSELYGFATVKTDERDYAPGTTVHITGTGWQPGETVTLLLHEAVEPPIHGDRMLTAVADAFGNIANSEFAPEEHDFGVRFYLTASSGASQAQTTFTDAVNINSFASDCATASDSFTSGTTVCAKATGLGSNASGKIEWWAPGAVSATRTTTFGPLNGNAIDSFAPSTCGTWTLKVYKPATTFEDDDTFEVTNCNSTPSVTANNQSFDEGTSTNYSASWSDPDAGQSHTCTIDFGDGGGPQAGTISPAQPSTSGTCSASHTYADGPNSYTITVSVSDGTASGSDTATATVNNLNPSISSVTNDGPITEGSSATITVTASDPAGVNDPLSYEFDCNNDSTYEIGPQSGNTASCSYADNGSYPVNVRVTDGDGGSATDSTTVQVNNAAPVVTAPADQTADEATSKSFSLGSFSDAGVNDGPWDVSVDWGDGSTDTTFSVASQGSLGSQSHTYADNGLYTVTVTVEDKDGDSGNTTFQVDVANLPPEITNVSNNGPVNEGSPVDITVTASDPAGAADPLSYSFDCNNDSVYEVGPQSSATGSCTFADNGTYTVGVKVDDGDGGVDTDSTVVAVNNVAPSVNAPTFSPGSSVDEGTNVTVSASFSDPGADTHTCTINFGDGSSVAGTVSETVGNPTTGTCSASHVYADDNPTGTSSDVYSATVTVTDDEGDSGNNSSNITVNNVAPNVTAAFTSTSVSCGTNNATLSFSFTDPGTDTFTASVDWGDGSGVQSLGAVTKGTTINVSHTYASAGMYNATVTVTDDDTGQGSDSNNPVTVNFTIVGGGVLPPINQDGSSIFKSKSTIPVKVKLQNCDGSYPSNLTPQIRYYLYTNNAPVGDPNEPLSTSAADTTGVMRFDSIAQQYIYNLAGKSLPDPAATYLVRITIPATNQTIDAIFGLKP